MTSGDPKFEPSGSHERMRRESWKAEDFDVYAGIHGVRGPIIEIGGPTNIGYGLVDLDSIEKKMHVSNLYPGTPLFDRESGAFVGFEGSVDFQADAQVLPFQNEALGAVFSAYLAPLEGGNQPVEARALRERAILEAHRVLEDRGLLVWQSGDVSDIEFAKRHGFQVLQYEIDTDTQKGDKHVKAIFGKIGDFFDKEFGKKHRLRLGTDESDPARRGGGATQREARDREIPPAAEREANEFYGVIEGFEAQYPERFAEHLLEADRVGSGEYTPALLGADIEYLRRWAQFEVEKVAWLRNQMSAIKDERFAASASPEDREETKRKYFEAFSGLHRRTQEIWGRYHERLNQLKEGLRARGGGMESGVPAVPGGGARKQAAPIGGEAERRGMRTFTPEEDAAISALGITREECALIFEEPATLSDAKVRELMEKVFHAADIAAAREAYGRSPGWRFDEHAPEDQRKANETRFHIEARLYQEIERRFGVHGTTP